MSAAEMTANGEKITAGAAQQIDQAIGELLEAQRIIAEIQREVWPAGQHVVSDKAVLWHRLETIDDRIHAALSKLGD